MGKQWMWKFAYPEGPNSIGVLHVPANRPVRLLITSRDVIHSFFVPAFRIKMDALPGRYTEIWFNATKPGRYQILCTEYCGAQHSQDVGRGRGAGARGLRRVDQGAAARPGVPAGRAGRRDRARCRPQGSLVQWGKQVAVDAGLPALPQRGQRAAGTSDRAGWTSTSSRTKLTDGREIIADEAYLTESMMEPTVKVVAGYQPLMPNYQGKLTGPEAAAIVEYIKSLRVRPDRARPPEVKSNDRADHHHRRAAPAGAAFPKKHYLNDGTTIRPGC